MFFEIKLIYKNIYVFLKLFILFLNDFQKVNKIGIWTETIFERF